MVLFKLSKYALFLIFLINLSAFAQPHAEIDYDRIDYLKHKRILQNFKSNLSSEMLAYYLPRKRYIDKQSIYPYAGTNYQIFIIKRGTYLRTRNQKNRKEIQELERFLQTANDFELNRYFGEKEEYYLGIRSEIAIRDIKKDARRDEAWRLKTDPEFARYLKSKASSLELEYYKKNLSLFYGEFIGKERIAFLQKKSKNPQAGNLSKTASWEAN